MPNSRTVSRARGASFLALALAGCPGFGRMPPAVAEPGADWCSGIGDLLIDRCATCHGEAPRNGAPASLRLDVYWSGAGRVGAGQSAWNIVAWVMDTSSARMPPPASPQLSTTEIAALRDWAARGAPYCGEVVAGDAGPEDMAADVLDAGDAATDGSGDSDAGDLPAEIPDLPDSPPPTLDEMAELFDRECGRCHVDRARGGLSLVANDALRERLLSPSRQVPSLPQIAPGEIDRSYLWHKVVGTQRNVGGQGESMEMSRSGEDALRAWIEAGAPE